MFCHLCHGPMMIDRSNARQLRQNMPAFPFRKFGKAHCHGEWFTVVSITTLRVVFVWRQVHGSVVSYIIIESHDLKG